MNCSKYVWFTRKKKLTIALKSCMLQQGNAHLRPYYRQAEEIADYLCRIQPEEQDDYQHLDRAIVLWAQHSAV